MKNQESIKLRRLARAVGDFIRYWGFRRIHGQIWTVLYLAKQPMSGTELTKLLKVSKALVSPALGDLEGYKLIIRVPGDKKTKNYIANPDVFNVIKEVLKTREQELLMKASKTFQDLQKEQNADLDRARLESLHEMIKAASTMLGWLISNTEEGQFGISP